jgi:hypothetical protein
MIELSAGKLMERNGIMMTYDIDKEKREAVDAGYRALQSLKNAKAELNSAKNWGIMDLLGGGMLSGLIKHSKMGKAQQYMEQAKYDLSSFSRELNDVNMACDLNIDVGGFLSFADFFFDGVVADWLVQDRINEARRQVDDAIWQVQQIVNQLS